jgi:hypothetical protein
MLPPLPGSVNISVPPHPILVFIQPLTNKKMRKKKDYIIRIAIDVGRAYLLFIL